MIRIRDLRDVIGMRDHREMRLGGTAPVLSCRLLPRLLIVGLTARTAGVTARQHQAAVPRIDFPSQCCSCDAGEK